MELFANKVLSREEKLKISYNLNLIGSKTTYLLTYLLTYYSVMNIKRKKGSFTVEFAMGFFLLIIFIISIFEVSRFVFISNMIESINIESSRNTKEVKSYEVSESYNNMLIENAEKWPFVDKNKLSFKVTCYDSYDSLMSGLKSQDCKDSLMYKFNLSYNYNPIFHDLIFSDNTISSIHVLQPEHYEF